MNNTKNIARPPRLQQADVSGWHIVSYLKIFGKTNSKAIPANIPPITFTGVGISDVLGIKEVYKVASLLFIHSPLPILRVGVIDQDVCVCPSEITSITVPCGSVRTAKDWFQSPVACGLLFKTVVDFVVMYFVITKKFIHKGIKN